LSSTTAPLRSAASRARERRWAPHIVGFELEQAGELPFVRGEHGGRAPLAEELEPSRVGVQAVGVYQQRRLDGACDRPCELGRAVAATEPRPEHDRPCSLGHLLHYREPLQRVGPVLLREAAAHLLEQPHVDRRLS
jgi:hypothetical protein